MQYSEELIKVNRFIFKKILETIRWLSIQGIAVRGDDEYDESHNKGNFIELLQLRCIDIPELKQLWLIKILVQIFKTSAFIY